MFAAKAWKVALLTLKVSRLRLNQFCFSSILVTSCICSAVKVHSVRCSSRSWESIYWIVSRTLAKSILLLMSDDLVFIIWRFLHDTNWHSCSVGVHCEVISYSTDLQHLASQQTNFFTLVLLIASTSNANRAGSSVNTYSILTRVSV